MIKGIYRHFAKPMNLAILNGVLIAILIGVNIYFQAFCIPTPWAIAMLSICFANTIVYPILQNTKLVPLTSFINGVSLFVYIYCIIFLDEMNLVGFVMILIGIGLVVFIPHFIVVQLIWKNVFNPKIKSSRYYFLAAVILCMGMVIYIGQDYRNAISSIGKFKETNYKELDQNFMTEKILGMHFIYHTKYCEFDGWRPPKHEPILVIGMWLNDGYDPLPVNLKTRLELYKKFFPENRYKFNCSCGIEYSQTYHDDELWKH